MAENGNTLTPQRRRFVEAMLTAKTIGAAAKKVDIGRRTADRWMTRPDVKAALAEAQTQSLGHTTRRLSAGMTRVLDTLEAIHTDRDIPPGTRVSAARAWCDATLRYSELADLTERVAELERTHQDAI